MYIVQPSSTYFNLHIINYFVYSVLTKSFTSNNLRNQGYCFSSLSAYKSQNFIYLVCDELMSKSKDHLKSKNFKLNK